MESEKLKHASRIDNLDFIQKIRDQFAGEWEETVTGKGAFADADFGYADAIRSGKKVPGSDKWLHDKLVRIGQDYRLTPDEIDRLCEIFLE